ncbi:MAG: alpha/beta hydrolase [Chloroflexota bacterium]
MPLLMIHGFPLDHETWKPISGELEGSFDMIMPDLPGFGKSVILQYPMSIREYAECLSNLLDHLGIEKTLVAGHSMGGYAALEFARQYSKKMLGLVLIGSQARADTPEKKAGRFETIDRVNSEGIAAVAGMAEKLSNDQSHQPFFKQMIERQNPAGVKNGLMAMAGREDMTGFIPAFNFPITLIHGLSDPLISHERAREIKEILPSSILIELPGIGHSPMLEAAAQTKLAFEEMKKSI